MNKDEMIQFYKEYEEKLSAYQTALETIAFDQATIAPKAGEDARNQASAMLHGELFSHMTNEHAMKVMDDLTKEDIEPILLKSIQQRLRSIRDIRILPKEVYVDYERTSSKTQSMWEKAKKANDYKLYEPYLIKLIEKKKNLLTYRKESLSDYEKLLDDFEEGMSIEKYEVFFQEIKTKLIPFIKEIQTKGKAIDTTPLEVLFPINKQTEFMKVLQSYMNYDSNYCYMGVSMHPFTTKLCDNDLRITTAYHEHALTSSIFSTIHEYGHALYSLQVDRKYAGSILMDNMSMGMQESQSRMLENCIGRTKAYWINNYKPLQNLFPEQLSNISFDDFIKMINASKPSLIRTEADELTYPLHILIRYEIEKAIFNDNINCEHLDELWADKYEEYLGVRPLNDAEGILQDIHWSVGEFGYFPTYALGSGFAAQFFKQMKQDIDVDDLLANNNFSAISEWLKENIHQYGSYLNANEILTKVTGHDFDPSIYTDYLINKYKEIYHI
ncbi:MAG: carboxypeptidase M32 [Erysipelotrichaceae bacterium]